MTHTLARKASSQNSYQKKSAAYLSAAVDFFDSARLEAEAGDLNAAGRLILKALEQERRAGGVGPQVLQLIKPRH